MGRNVVLTISDLQMPFEHRDALDFILHIKKTLIKPSDSLTVVNMGDEFDEHALARYAPNPDGFSAGEEIQKTIEHAGPWYQAFPKMKLCISNHTIRGTKKAREIGIPSKYLRTLAEVYECPKRWEWDQRWVIGNVCYEHGENVSGVDAALKAATHNRMNTVIGHQHSHGGVIHSGSFHNTLWGMNTGCLIDTEAYAFKYAVAYRKKPTLGTGLLINEVPLFIPMILNHKRRWIRRLI